MIEPVPEFSRVLNAARLPVAGVEEILEAKPDERKALAKRFELLEVKLLKAQLVIEPSQRNAVNVSGKIEATVVQSCVVTLDPLTNHLDIDVDVTFVPEEQNADGAGSPLPEEEEEEIEVYTNGKIDLGELVAQQLGVNIDPYPRKPNAKLPVTEVGPKVEKKRSPFEHLAEVVKKKGKTKD